jgi:hypothetical protein
MGLAALHQVQGDRDGERQMTDWKVERDSARKVRNKIMSTYQEAQREYYRKHRKLMLDVEHQMYRALRAEVVTLLGGKCVRCGIDDSDVLQIDHRNGGGCKEIKALGSGYPYLKRVRNAVLNSKRRKSVSRYQLLCANCNWKKRKERNEVRRSDSSVTYPSHQEILEEWVAARKKVRKKRGGGK